MSRHIVLEGNLTRDPQGGYGKDTGKAHTHLDIAVTDRSRNTEGEWIDGPVTHYRVTTCPAARTAARFAGPSPALRRCFNRTAENALNSLTKGNTVLVTGQLTVRSYTRTPVPRTAAERAARGSSGPECATVASPPRRTESDRLDGSAVVKLT